jgi:hypothetical protein
MRLQLTFITSRDDFMEAPTSVQCTPRSMDHVRAVCNCDDVLILAFHAAFENDSFPLRWHASVISACPERQRPPPANRHRFPTKDWIQQRGDAIERPLGVCGYQCSEARPGHIPAALRHMHDVVTCGGVDGGSIKPPDEWRR